MSQFRPPSLHFSTTKSNILSQKLHTDLRKKTFLNLRYDLPDLHKKQTNKSDITHQTISHLVVQIGQRLNNKSPCSSDRSKIKQ